eukprot:g3742.t1
MPDWLRTDAVTIPKLLKEAGYATAHYGKWHLANNMIPDSPSLLEYGYDEYGAFNCSGVQMPYYEDADRAIAFMEKSKAEKKPFFINLWVHEPHTPHHVIPEYQWPFRNLDEKANIYAAILAHADERIGEVLDALDEMGLTENTLVIFSSDNGPAPETEELTTMYDSATGVGFGTGASVGVTGGRKGAKHTLWEGGIGVPFLARWPGKIAAGEIDDTSLISAVDLLPTFVEIAGAKLPADYEPDGITQVKTLEASQGPVAAADKQPNILFILTDDQGYGDLGAHGHPYLKTPNLDKLRGESVRFENFYVSPSCSPTRAALLTGMHEFSNGVTHTIQPREHLSQDAVLLPELLKSAGYRTGFIGKWHLGNDGAYAPHKREFDWSSTNVGGPHKFFDPVMIRNGKREKAEGFREDLFFDDAMTFIDGGDEDQPFFCYLATYSPHAPVDAPEEFIAPYRGKVTGEQAKYLGMIANIDYNVGRILNHLEESGKLDNTIIVFMNDNGVTLGLDVYNAGMRGSKCTIWQGGSRAMSFWKWGQKWEPHAVDKLTAHLDVLPTLCHYAGVEIPGETAEKLEGFSLRPLLESSEVFDWNEDRLLFHHVARWPSGLAASHKYAMAAVQTGDYLLVQSHDCGDPECEKFSSQCTTLRSVERGSDRATYTAENAQFHWGVTPHGRWMLFNLKDDPECERDLSMEKPEFTSKLAGEYDRWWDETYPEERDKVMALADLTTAPRIHPAEDLPGDERIRGIFYETLPYMGKETRAFAWLGIPELPAEGKAPGIVLVHGGGGSAFKEWVNEWTSRGYVAISIAVEGQTTQHASEDTQHKWAGPMRNGIYGDSMEKLEDQWMYHAVADTILANSLLRSLPEVDRDRIGLMGISWGGVITSTVIGIDDRFAFAIPVYGCGSLATAGNQYGRALGDNHLYQEVWDPMVRIGRATLPTLWLSWPQDQHFPLDRQAATYDGVSAPHMVTLIPGLGHGHKSGWKAGESYAFADGIVNGSGPWCIQESRAIGSGKATVEFIADKMLDEAVLVSTTDRGVTGDREWLESVAKLVNKGGKWIAEADLPEGTTGWFMNVKSGGLTASSDYCEMETSQ